MNISDCHAVTYVVTFTQKNSRNAIAGGPVVSTLANAFSPLYFEVTEAMEVMATEEPCDVACKFGDGLLDIDDCPQGFPRPCKTHCLYLFEVSHFHFVRRDRLLVVTCVMLVWNLIQ